MARRLPLWLSAAFAAAVLAGPAGADSFSDLKPVAPQPAADALAPGLAVNYVVKMARSVDEFETGVTGLPGPPLPSLNYQSGAGKVLTSDKTDGVGALITGFINFPAAGRWLMATNSNDGVRVRVAGTVVIDDPNVHPDQYSSNAEINITQPGWYALNVTYFERKGTSTLQLYWQRPDKTEFEIVPAEAFAHAK